MGLLRGRDIGKFLAFVIMGFYLVNSYLKEFRVQFFSDFGIDFLELVYI